MLRYTTDRARPGLVALYDIRPGNGVGLFLQPRNPHGAVRVWFSLELQLDGDTAKLCTGWHVLSSTCLIITIL